MEDAVQVAKSCPDIRSRTENRVQTQVFAALFLLFSLTPLFRLTYFTAETLI